MKQLRLLHRGTVTIVAGLVLGMAASAGATVVPGDQFVMDISETSPAVIPDLGTATVTVGGPSGTPGFNTITAFSVIGQGSTCFTCGLISQDFSGLLFDTTSLDLQGTMTGSFLGNGGHLHDFTLVLTDAPDPTWTFTDVKLFDNSTSISSGTYTTELAPVPEPSTLLLLASALVGLGGTTAWRKGRRAA